MHRGFYIHCPKRCKIIRSTPPFSVTIPIYTGCPSVGGVAAAAEKEIERKKKKIKATTTNEDDDDDYVDRINRELTRTFSRSSLRAHISSAQSDGPLLFYIGNSCRCELLQADGFGTV